MRIKPVTRLFAGILTLILLFRSMSGVAAQTDDVLWDAWATMDVARIGDDNSGSTATMTDDVQTPDGASTLRVTPSGSADETKIAIPLTSADIQPFTTYSHIEIDVYLPAENALAPNRFFMGMADVTDGFSWVAGVFSETQVQSGWNRVVYPLHPAMREPIANADYMLFLSFFYEDTSGKQALTEPFFLGAAYLTQPIGGNTMAATEASYQAQVDTLLRMDDAALLDAVARETFDYFWNEANPDNGLIRDRSTPTSAASIAAVGFGLTAIPIGIDRGWINREQGYERVRTTLETFLNGGVEGVHGFFFHFVDMNTGRRAWNSELSSIDTTLLVAGALAAGEYFEGTEVAEMAQRLYENVEWDWMQTRKNALSMGWTPEEGFIDALWDHFDESIILYALAIGSPTHPVSAETWTAWERPVNTTGEYIYLPGEPLFVYQYPLAWLDLRNREDAFANYFNNTVRACERNRQFSIDNADRYTTYQNGVWGLSASDGPNGYRAYGAWSNNHDGTIAPYASVSCLPFTPQAALESTRAMLQQYGSRVWREYGFVSAINADANWYSKDHIGIDQGDILLMIANYQDGFVWNLFAINENIQHALDLMGFVESRGDYAVTPDYLAQVKR
jgi:hypothetical protein